VKRQLQYCVGHCFFIDVFEVLKNHDQLLII
jgi:hypothetical protein